MDLDQVPILKIFRFWKLRMSISGNLKSKAKLVTAGFYVSNKHLCIISLMMNIMIHDETDYIETIIVNIETCGKQFSLWFKFSR